MKKIILILILTGTYTMAKSQFYFGGNLGVVVEKSYDNQQKKIRNGINDLYLAIPLGYTTNNLLFEINPECTASLLPSIAGSVGGKVDFSEHCGIHFLAGYKDEMLVQTKPSFSITNFFHPNVTTRIWTGNFSIQGSYIFRKEIYGGNSLNIGIGIIGF